MMKKIITLSIAMMLLLGTISAQYYNRIIPFEFEYPSSTRMTLIGDTIYFPVIYSSVSSTLIKIVDSNFEYHHIDNFIFSIQSGAVLNDKLYFFAKDRSQSKGLKLGKWNGVDTLDWIIDYPTDGIYNFAAPSLGLNNHIYFGYSQRYSDDHRDIGMRKVDSEGNVVWVKRFNANNDYSRIDQVKSSLDGGLVFTCNTVDRNYKRFLQLWKLDPNGDVIWVNEIDMIRGGASRIGVAVLSNGNYVLANNDSKSRDQEFHRNGWNTDPIQLRWFDSEGVEFQNKLLINKEHTHQITSFHGIKAGKGDYFFAYGSFDDGWNYKKYGLVIKFDNLGDTIWAKKYWHPDFAGKNNGHLFVDLHEMDNGDLVIGGNISPFGEEREVWLVRTNSDGCLSSNDCGDLVIDDLDTIIDTIPLANNIILLYPNPASDIVEIDISSEQWKEAYLLDFLGKKILDIEQKSFPVKGLPRGIYFVKIKTDRGEYVKKLVVE